jgi:predicted RNA-binding Zn-ribbon protein involved in translation (DUF1610 family)
MFRFDCPNCGLDIPVYLDPLSIVSGNIEIECPECKTKIPFPGQNQKPY